MAVCVWKRTVLAEICGNKRSLAITANCYLVFMKSPSPRKLNLFDSTCLIVGIIVGSGIYETPVTVANAVDNHWEIYLLWILGGAISLCGAMCYAELATTYPESGGDVVYLRKAYGAWAGFLFGWLQTFVARPGDISLMALVFARYVYVLVNPSATGDHPVWPAVAIVCLLTAVNIGGLHFGKTAQNFLTIVKIVGLLAIVACAFASPSPVAAAEVVESASSGKVAWGVALIMVLFTFGGWNEMVFVASEVHEPKKNISRALFLGTISVTVLYLLANAAYLHALTLPGMASSNALATDAVARVLPRAGQLLVAGVIAISAAGAINGLVLCGARITGSMRRYPAFDWLSHWHPKLQTPVRALVLEAVIAILVIVIAQRFENALIYTSAAVYTFYLATSISSVVLRIKDPNAERLYRMPLYPLPVIVFGAGCIWAVWSGYLYRPRAAAICMGVIAAGALVFFVQNSRKADTNK